MICMALRYNTFFTQYDMYHTICITYHIILTTMHIREEAKLQEPCNSINISWYFQKRRLKVQITPLTSAILGKKKKNQQLLL